MLAKSLSPMMLLGLNVSLKVYTIGRSQKVISQKIKGRFQCFIFRSSVLNWRYVIFANDMRHILAFQDWCFKNNDARNTGTYCISQSFIYLLFCHIMAANPGNKSRLPNVECYKICYSNISSGVYTYVITINHDLSKLFLCETLFRFHFTKSTWDVALST